MPTATVDISHALDPARTNGRTVKRLDEHAHTAQIASAATTLASPSAVAAKDKASTAPSITDAPRGKLTVDDTAYVA